MYIIAHRAYFCHLLGLGQVRDSPRGSSGSAGTWTGAQCGQAPSPLATPIHPQNGPSTPLGAPNTPNAPIPLLAPEYLECLLAPYTPDTP